jgi:endonuclease YncB( thermonuclease family)
MKSAKLLIQLAFLLLFSISGFAQDQQPQTNPPFSDDAFEAIVPAEEKWIEGKVVGVHDGDTCTVLDAAKTQHKIRFNGIDAPELKQDFGNRSKQNLSDLIFGKTVRVHVTKKDKYNREVGVVFVEGRDANLQQIKDGFAWHYKKYAGEQFPKEREEYAKAETAAQTAKLGLWADAKPTPPWNYRQGADVAPELAGKIFGNKNSKVYHWAGCSGFTKLSEASRVVFNSPAEAESNGYRAAKNCSQPKPTGAATPTASEIVQKPSPNSTLAPNAPTRPRPTAKEQTPETPVSTQPAQPTAEPSDGRTYIKGERGGCYYLNSSGKKTYVDRSLCN